jgi:hypothetical protein
MEQISNLNNFESEQFWIWIVSKVNSFEFEQFRIGTFSNWNIFEFETAAANERENRAYEQIHREKTYEYIGPAHHDPAPASAP